MKKSISFLLCGALVMTGMYCKKDSSGVKPYTSQETVQNLARDPDFLQLYKGVRDYNSRVGASGQVALFAGAIDDEKAFGMQTRSYFDQMTAKFPIDAEQGLLQRARVVSLRHGLTGKKEIELREILDGALNIVDPISSLPPASARTSNYCFDALIRRETRCDREMAIGGIESVLIGSATILTATGVGVPLAAGVAAVALASKWLRHSNCINDALRDYRTCSNPY